MRRRHLLAMLAGAAAWPRLALAQARQRHVGVLLATAQDDPETKVRVAALSQGLRDAGWIEGKTLRLDYRFDTGDPDSLRADARALVAEAPEVIVVHSNPFVAALREIDRTIPAVFVQVGDPIGSGFIDGLAHPGGNMTGFTSFESGIGGKWLETLRETAPSLARALVLVEANNAAHRAFLQAAESAGAASGVAVASLVVGSDSDLAGPLADFAAAPQGGLVILPSPIAAARRAEIAALAAKQRLPSIAPYRFFVAAGALASYGVDNADLYRRTAAYVDRILRGAKPADLPVQEPTKYLLVLNAKTAKALGLMIPATLLARADEVIE